jgi:adenosine deaminase
MIADAGRDDLEDWFARVPKVELHLHLEGAIPHTTLWELIQKYGGDASVPSLDALAARFQFRDFTHFLAMWIWKNQFLRTYEDFTFIAEAVARDLASQNIRYVEAFFSPSRFAHYGLTTQKLAEAIRTGLCRVPEVEVALVADLVRDHGPARAAVTLREVHEVRDMGVIGVGIGGSEHLFPPQLFQEVFAQARRFGLRTTAHAGEAAGAESIWGAVRALGVDRIGHGTRAEEDEALLDYLAAHAIPLEMCPLSNVCTGVVPSIEKHPVRRYVDRGLVVTINTDDPKMFGNSLADEFRVLSECFGFTRQEIRTCILHGVQAAWLPPDRKQKLTEAFAADPAWSEGGNAAIPPRP